MTAHFEFLSRTEAGSCAMVVEEVKLGRQLSVLHVTLFQNGLLSQAPWIDTALSRKEVTAYVTMTNLGVEKGLSLPTGFSLEPPPPPADLPKLSKDQDALWGRLQFPKHGGFGSMRVLKNVEYYIPKRGQSSKSVIDAWIRLASGEGFTNTSLGYVADCYPYVVESYRPNPPSSGSPKGEGVEPFPFDQAFWYPTVTLNLELKKSVPETGVEWLFMRVQSKQVKKGRLDLEVIIMDEAGELVALSQHVNLIVGGERNLSKRRTKQGQL
ncbi:Thioesterase-like superfamily-domain-containing protein [Pleurostoma richardsiae]|uniref:Thioesterase-like superfamily-domain-containing protein n=1 Tax=Pleurostoma richardsiae TaxID=41990 RepID=A0AA38RQ69_9PEZI|nr:Thioesterase-like superfamily-domain-containing protein [Pleurostoma richardsiae]